MDPRRGGTAHRHGARPTRGWPTSRPGWARAGEGRGRLRPAGRPATARWPRPTSSTPRSTRCPAPPTSLRPSSTPPACWCTRTSAGPRCRRGRRRASSRGRHERRGAGPRHRASAARAGRARSPRCSPPSRRRGRARGQQRRRGARAGRHALGAGRRWSSPAASWSRSATASASPTCSRRPARGCARSGRPTGSRSPTTPSASARRPARCSRCTRRTSSSAASPAPVEVAELARRSASRWSPTSARGCSRRTRCCPTSPTCRPRWPPAPTSSWPAATSCSAGRRPGWCSGAAELVQRLRRHPLYRALRVDKTTLAALEATLRGPRAARARDARTPTRRPARRAPRALAAALAGGLGAEAVDAEARVGGGGAPGVALPSAAVALPSRFAAPLRRASPPVVGHLERRAQPAGSAQPSRPTDDAALPPPCWRSRSRWT